MEGRCQAFSIEIEKKVLDKLGLVRTEQDRKTRNVEEELKVTQKELEKLRKEETEERERAAEKGEQREKENRQWTESEIEKSKTEGKDHANSVVLSSEISLRKDLVLQGSQLNEELRKKDLQTNERLDGEILNIRNEMNKELEDEKRIRSHRLNDITDLVETTKNMLNEHVTQQIESVKALTKAVYNKENAERHRADETMSIALGQRLDAVDKMLTSRLTDEIEKMNVRVETHRAEFVEVRDNHEERLQQVHTKSNENRDMIQENEKNTKEALYKMERDCAEKMENFEEKVEREAEVRSVMNALVAQVSDEAFEVRAQQIYQQTEEALKDHRECLDALQVQHTTEYLANRATLDAMDDKFEEALQEVANSIDGYIAVMQEANKKQYEEFNKSLKEKFGENIAQVQEHLAKMREELDQQREKIQSVEVNLNEVDYNAKKGLEEEADRREIDRCVREMVSEVVEKRNIDNLKVLQEDQVWKKTIANSWLG